jgi:hypothetical protein
MKTKARTIVVIAIALVFLGLASVVTDSPRIVAIGLGIIAVVGIAVLAKRSGSSGGAAGRVLEKTCLSCGAFVERGTHECPRCGGNRFGWG